MNAVTSAVVTRKNLTYVLVVFCLFLLVFELVMILPRALDWHPWDYGNYVKMGTAIRAGQNPYGPDRYYPLPTMLWIFVPLSVMPDWFRLVWILFPVIFLLILFRSRAIWFALFPPLWFLMSDAMFDGWLLIPLAWVFLNRPVLAGAGAALLLFKPHVFFLVVGFLLAEWLIKRHWTTLKTFAITFAVLWLPSFLVDPLWPSKMLAVLQTRAEQVSLLPLLTSSVWSWWWLNLPGKIICVGLLIASGFLLWRVGHDETKRAPALQSFSLLINPVMLASNVVTVLPGLVGTGQIAVVVFVSLFAFGLDRVMGGFGGGYALIPLAALYIQAFGLPQRSGPAK